MDGKTRTCGLIGNPVEHTMSPAIHNTLATRRGHNLVYVPFLVEEGQVDTAVKGAYALNVLGMNVTVPYKSEVTKSLVEVDELAAQIGAVNTLVRVADGYKGYNTDMLGLYRAMLEDGVQIEGEEIVLLGAGGAARAVAYLCASKGAVKVYMLNRTLEKAQEVAAEVNQAVGKEIIVPMLLTDYEKLPDKQFLAIQGTSVGLAPHDDEVVIADEAFYQKIHTGYDLIYRPFNTRFMQLVKEAGGEAYNGLKMLLYQGIIAYELWNEVEITKEDAQAAYEKMKEAMGL
ncbi:MAG: shikimate dehydrogenase [Lachnospiraceae bacterium]|nr:shikimate dehydrogenase [Lachnospiraceae bacterium]